MRVRSGADGRVLWSQEQEGDAVGAALVPLGAAGSVRVVVAVYRWERQVEDFNQVFVGDDRTALTLRAFDARGDVLWQTTASRDARNRSTTARRCAVVGRVPQAQKQRSTETSPAVARCGHA